MRRRLDPAEPHLPHLHHVSSVSSLFSDFNGNDIECLRGACVCFSHRDSDNAVEPIGSLPGQARYESEGVSRPHFHVCWLKTVAIKRSQGPILDLFCIFKRLELCVVALSPRRVSAQSGCGFLIKAGSQGGSTAERRRFDKNAVRYTTDLRIYTIICYNVASALLHYCFSRPNLLRHRVDESCCGLLNVHWLLYALLRHG